MEAQGQFPAPVHNHTMSLQVVFGSTPTPSPFPNSLWFSFVQAGLRTLHDIGPEIQRAISGSLETDWNRGELEEPTHRVRVHPGVSVNHFSLAVFSVITASLASWSPPSTPGGSSTRPLRTTSTTTCRPAGLRSNRRRVRAKEDWAEDCHSHLSLRWISAGPFDEGLKRQLYFPPTYSHFSVKIIGPPQTISDGIQNWWRHLPTTKSPTRSLKTAARPYVSTASKMRGWRGRIPPAMLTFHSILASPQMRTVWPRWTGKTAVPRRVPTDSPKRRRCAGASPPASVAICPVLVAVGRQISSARSPTSPDLSDWLIRRWVGD